MGTQGNNSSGNKKRDANPPAEVRTGPTGSENKGKGYIGPLPKCDVCHHHAGQCRFRKCENCGKNGHSNETRWAGTSHGNGSQRGNGDGNGNRGGNGNGNRNNQGSNGNCGGSGNQASNGNHGANNNQGGNGNGNGRAQGCFGCGDVGHFKRDCPKNNQAQGRVFNIEAREARQDPNVVTSTFPINQHFTSVLFDIGADYSFVSLEFKDILGLVASKLDIPYSIELANGKLVEASEVIKGCVMELGEHYPYPDDEWRNDRSAWRKA
ncbi:probable ATP-dependent RNA helicase vasa-like [Helianthus annuus]|uniref:probable ATP-dependent RNA helicase vasa-like n=1 Tax=Helianthus annuus TaxID=4232 RepID=UPI000B8FC570|nr:probable ATP-dependent RNA helicase vasa-like [Helianthus annuus]